MAIPTNEDPVSPEADFSKRVIEQFYENWIDPELARRNSGVINRESVRKAVIVMSPHEPTLEIRLNDEAALSARVRYRNDKSYGDFVSAHDILDVEELAPESVHPDAGWIALVALPDGRQYASFDLRRNRGAARALIARADEYFAAATKLLSDSLIAPGIDCLQGAYELGVKALMGIYGGGVVSRSHGKNKRWIEDWARLGNVPESNKRLVSVLMEYREAARYTPHAVADSKEKTQQLVTEVREFLDHVRSRAGSPQ